MGLWLFCLLFYGLGTPLGTAANQPNILFCISDDQSWEHASAYGCKAINTPNFDRVAREGILFRNAFAPSPGCSPTRAAVLTGRHIWQIEQAGTHASSFPQKYPTYPDILEREGYFIGGTGKLWGPGNFQVSGRPRNPAGPAYNRRKLKPPYPGISGIDYAGNFKDFLQERPADKPFCFWYGASEPHRAFSRGIGLKEGKKLADVQVPSFLPDTDEVRSDLLDYFVEIEWFDRHLGRMLEMLEAEGALENTLVIVTSDNGMAFPRAKANLYEYGFHMPLAIRWGAEVMPGRVVDDLVSFVDLTATILEAAGVKDANQRYALAGASLMNILKSDQQGIVDPSRKYVVAGRERHSSSRYLSLGYPQRAVRSQHYLYIRNGKPERWPAGAPQKYEASYKGPPINEKERLDYVEAQTEPGPGKLGPMHGAYHDIDACPTLDYLIEHMQDPEVAPFFHLAVDRRPEVEFYDIKQDPGCLHNLAENPDYAELREAHARYLSGILLSSKDPRMNGSEVFESYRRYSGIRLFPVPDWARQGKVPQPNWAIPGGNK